MMPTEEEVSEMIDYNGNTIIELFVKTARDSRSHLCDEEIAKRVDDFCNGDRYLEERKEYILERIREPSNKRVKFAD